MVESGIKLKLIKLLQTSGLNGITIKEIKAQMQDVQMDVIKNMLEGFVDSGLARFSGLRDTYHWVTKEKTEQKHANEQKPKPPVVSKNEIEAVATRDAPQTLVNILFDEINSLRNGASECERAKSVAGLATQIINAGKLELDYRRHMNEK